MKIKTTDILHSGPWIWSEFWTIRFLFEKEFLACYWALIKTTPMTEGHRLIWKSEIPIMSQWCQKNALMMKAVSMKIP